MGNGEFQISDQARREWIQSNRSNKRLFYNKVTEDEFQLITQSKVKAKSNISQILQRSIYPLANTPKVIVLDDTSNSITILVQSKTYELKTKLSHISLLFQLLQIIRQIVGTLNCLYCRFGPFRITDGMICFNKSQRVMVWINEKFECSQIQAVLPPCEYPQQQMLIDLLKKIKESSSLQLQNNLFVNPLSTFSLFLSRIDQIIKQQRYILLNKKVNHPSKQLQLKQFSPRNKIRQLHLNSQIQIQQYKVKKGEQIKEKYKVPNFIKNTKFNKRNMNNVEQTCKNIYSRKDKNQINLGRIKSLNCSPQSKQVDSKLRESYKDKTKCSPILASRANLGSLLFSKSSTKAEAKTNNHPQACINSKVFIPAIKNLRAKQSFECSESCLQTESDKIGNMTFRNPPTLSNSVSLGLLNSYCKSISQSRELDNKQQGNSDISLIGGNCSIIIHESKDQSVFDGKYIKIYEEFSKILF